MARKATTSRDKPRKHQPAASGDKEPREAARGVKRARSSGLPTALATQALTLADAIKFYPAPPADQKEADEFLTGRQKEWQELNSKDPIEENIYNELLAQQRKNEGLQTFMLLKDLRFEDFVYPLAGSGGRIKNLLVVPTIEG